MVKVSPQPTGQDEMQYPIEEEQQELIDSGQTYQHNSWLDTSRDGKLGSECVA